MFAVFFLESGCRFASSKQALNSQDLLRAALLAWKLKICLVHHANLSSDWLEVVSDSMCCASSAMMEH